MNSLCLHHGSQQTRGPATFPHHTAMGPCPPEIHRDDDITLAQKVATQRFQARLSTNTPARLPVRSYPVISSYLEVTGVALFFAAAAFASLFMTFASLFAATGFVSVFEASALVRTGILAVLVPLGAATAGAAWPFTEFPWLPAEDTVVALPVEIPLPVELVLVLERVELVFAWPDGLRASAGFTEPGAKKSASV